MFPMSLPVQQFASRHRRAFRRGAAVAALAVVAAIPAALAAPAGGCQLNSPRAKIQHVIEIQFDNVHFTRDNPNVPSDLEQMPHLLNFIESNGALLANQHTALVSNSATGMVTTLTGVYGDRHGAPVSNSFRYFLPNGTSDAGVTFTYWTSPLFDPSNPASPTDTTYNMLTADGHNAPAPWVPFTRAGCNVGSVAASNISLENTGPDITTVFGATSTEAAEVLADPNQAFADFVAIAVHCGAGNALCSAGNNGKPDVLPDEPGGYVGFNGLFGHKYVAPQISPNGPLTDLNGNVIQDSNGRVGFPGFDGMSAAVSLAYVAAMQEHGVPVTFAYISDAHDNHPFGPAYGPGEAGYVAALKAYDDAFDKFFQRLAADGINAGNTLFVVTADENDHFVGGPPSPAGCDGVNVPCTYSQIGELNANLAGLLATEQGITTPFRVHSDSAPTVYITGNPARDAGVTRAFERGVAALSAPNPITGQTDALSQFLADPVELRLLHMVTADPARTPTFAQFGDADYFLFAGAPNCNAPCVTELPAFAWNHGDVNPDITTTWLGLVGPGVDQVGVDAVTWADQTDVRPTVLALVGLADDYAHDGRLLQEELTGWAIPAGAKKGGAFLGLAQMYKQIDAVVGPLGLASLQASTKALKSGSMNDDSVYAQIEAQLVSIGAQRDALAGQMMTLLEGAEFNSQAINQAQAQSLISQGQALLNQVSALAAQP